ncbi:unnamed protein product [Adineta steineri]|uniref:Uncharacterized protein n=1 Tax=Adineta steineri TaxID=433720 RepID=A0A818W0Q0_9BILA|nr:unnamed protein product [Adineta steineri]
MTSRFTGGTVEINNPSPTSGSRFLTLPRVLGVLVGIFAITTIIFATFYAIEKNKSPIIEIPTTFDTTPTTTTIVTTTPITTTVTTPTITTTVTTTPAATQDLCLTPYCIKAADYLIESIDESVEPCEDFFNFVCGTWIKNTRIPDDAGAQQTFNMLTHDLDYNIVDLLSSSPSSEIVEAVAVVNARQLYKSCINETAIEADGVDPILSLVNSEFGGWPILIGPLWDPSMFNLTNLLITLRKYNNNMFFRVVTSTDEKNSTSYDIEMGQGDLGLGQKQYYMSETPVTIAYRQFMTDVAKALTNDTSMIAQDVTDIFEFEKTIAQYHWTVAEQHARDNETIRTTVDDLSTILNTTFDFNEYITRAYMLGNVTLFGTDIVSISELDFLRNVSLLVEQTQPRIVQNYVIWRFMMNRVANLPQHLRILRERFIRVIGGTTAEPPRTITCGNFVNGNMGFAVSKLYIKKYFDETARSESLEMINNIRSAFIGMVNQSTWMDMTSQSRAIEKALAIDQKIGYPDYLASDNNTKLDEDYAEYNFDTSYINNVLKLLQIKAKENFRVLREPVDKKAWGEAPPSIVNAFYEPSKNQITFPAGILQKPFFDKNAPKYLNYGGIGVVIGHEITHGFDDMGRQFDKEGNRIPWWTDETIEKFKERKTCIVNQYSNYTVAQINMTAKGDQTQGEDIADNGGLREAYFAYEKWAEKNMNSDKRLPGLQKYSPEQMFFINYAHTWCIKMTDQYALSRVLTDVHSLGQFRAIGPTSNFDQFDRAFGCTPGQSNSRISY